MCAGWSRMILRPAVFALALVVTAFTARAQVAKEARIVNVADWATCDGWDQPPTDPPYSHCGERTSPWRGVGTDTTGGIAPALASCFTSNVDVPYRDGCVLVLPKGYVTIGATVDFRPPDGSSREGLIVRGHGAGFKDTAGSNLTYAGTTLQWAGGAGGTMLRVRNVRWSQFEQFALDGEGGSGAAGIGIEVTEDGTWSTSHNTFRHILIRDIRSQPTEASISDRPTTAGIGIFVGPTAANYQTSELVFEEIFIDRVGTGIYQRGEQTTNVLYRNVELAGYDDYGLDVQGGSVYTQSARFHSTATIPPVHSLADVRVGVPANWAVFRDNYHETEGCPAYLLVDDAPQDGVKRAFPTTFINTMVRWFGSPGLRVIDYQQHGAVTLIGCSFPTQDASDVGLIYIHNPYYGEPTAITSFGNMYPHTPADVRMDVGGYVSLVSDDDPFHLGEQANHGLPHSFVGAGFVLDEGSFNWKKSGTGVLFSQFLDHANPLQPVQGDEVLKLLDGSGSALSWWTPTGNLRMDRPSAAVEFRGAGGGTVSLRAADPGAGSATSTLPAVSGTIVVNTAAQALSNKDLSHPSNVFPSSLVTAAGNQTFTNKVIDVEAAGNSLSTVERRDLPAGTCRSATPGTSAWITSASNPSIICGGTNVYKAMLTFADSATGNAFTVVRLPPDWNASAPVDFSIDWYSSATNASLGVVWQVATTCVGDGESTDPAWNPAQIVVDNPKTVANQANVATITNVTMTGCAPGEALYVKLFRVPTHASDTLASAATVLGAQLTFRRTQ